MYKRQDFNRCSFILRNDYFLCLEDFLDFFFFFLEATTFLFLVGAFPFVFVDVSLLSLFFLAISGATCESSPFSMCFFLDDSVTFLLLSSSLFFFFLATNNGVWSTSSIRCLFFLVSCE